MRFILASNYVYRTKFFCKSICKISYMEQETKKSLKTKP